MERWVPVVGYEGLYDVSDLGRVRSLPRPTARGVRGGKVLTNWINPGGYPAVSLSQRNIVRNFQVHRLVLFAHVRPPRPGEESRHGIGGKLDASLANLCWGTRSENIYDRARDGQLHRGEDHPHAKLTASDVAEIRAAVAGGETQRSVAKRYGVVFQTINEIIRGRNWRTLGRPVDRPTRQI